jgi:hypothetical protein
MRRRRRDRRQEEGKAGVTVYSYVVEHDLGFAPNPFHSVCTLACCKPQIRKKAQEGDYILGTGAARLKLQGQLIYWMRVDEVLTFDEYWNDPRFKRKRPVMAGSTHLRYGDNIYHSDGGKGFRQEDSFHSLEDGSTSRGDLKRDTGTTDRILLARDFAYWGRSAVKLPRELRCFVKKGPGHLRKFTERQLGRFFEWLEERPERGYIDEPADWQLLGRRTKRARK